MEGFGVTVLRILNEKDYQERNDRRTRIDDELPGVGILKYRAGRSPHDDREHCQREYGRLTRCR